MRRSRNMGKLRKSFSSYRDLDAHHDSEDELTESEKQSKDEDFVWNEEQTLFSDLMEDTYVRSCI